MSIIKKIQLCISIYKLAWKLRLKGLFGIRCLFFYYQVKYTFKEALAITDDEELVIYFNSEYLDKNTNSSLCAEYLKYNPIDYDSLTYYNGLKLIGAVDAETPNIKFIISIFNEFKDKTLFEKQCLIYDIFNGTTVSSVIQDRNSYFEKYKQSGVNEYKNLVEEVPYNVYAENILMSLVGNDYLSAKALGDLPFDEGFKYELISLINNKTNNNIQEYSLKKK